MIPTETARANVLDEDAGEQYDEAEIVDRSERITVGEPEAIRAELSALDELQALAERVKPTADNKLQDLLRNTLRMMLARRHKAILFTRYRDTLEYLAEQIGKSPLFNRAKVITLHGGMNEVQRREAFYRFEQAVDAVMIATDAISEGVNLQHLANQLIHYELPWNPNRLEQRNGRIDRFGQPEATVVIRLMIMNDTLDAVILEHLVEKTRRIRAEYGFAPPFFGDENNIIDFIREHGRGIHLGPAQLSLFDTLAQNEAAPQDPFSPELLERIREESFYGQTDISLGVVQEQMRKVQQTVGSQEEIRRFVLSGLNRLNCLVVENTDGTLRIVIRHPDLKMPGIGDAIERATFDPQVGANYNDVDVLDLGHPLVRRLMDVLKRQAFEPDRSTPEAQARYGRTSLLLTGEVSEMTALYTLLVRYTTATNPPQILEDLLTLAAPLYSEGILDETAVGRLLEARPAPGTVTPGEAREVLSNALGRSDLEQLFATSVEARRQALEADRRRLREELQRQAGWLEGADHLSVSSWDLLSVKVLWPV
jgi:hypothetical protein